MKRVELALLPALHELLKTGSVSTAASNLCLSQSAVSKILTKLRLSFDDELLIKSGRGFVLSPKAEQLLIELSQLMPTLEALWHHPTLDLANENRTIQIAGTDLDLHVINQSLTKINKLAPKLKLSLSLSHTDSIHDLSTNKIDILLTAFNVDTPELIKQVLFTSAYIVVSNTQFEKGLDIDNYLSLPHISFQLSSDQQSAVDIALNKQHLNRDIKMWVPTFQQALSAVSHTDKPLLLTLPKKVIEQSEHSLEKYYLYEPPFLMHALKVHLYYHRKYENDPLVKWAVEKIKEEL